MKILKWFLMLNKRLYKKASFIAILVLIPLCVMLFSSASDGEKGFMHITLARTNPDDVISSEIIDNLMSESSVIRFSVSSSPSEAVEAVKNGKADEAWIFPSDTHAAIKEYISSDTDKFISVISKEESVFAMLSREKLSSALYEYTAKAYYLDFARVNLPELDKLTDDELLHYFNTVSIDEELFTFSSPDSTDSFEENPDINYLTTPVRGFMGILIMICGMASALYLMQDEKNGTFSLAREGHRILLGFISMVIAVVNISVAAFLSLTLSGLSMPALKELINLLVFVPCVTAFALALKYILSSIRLYAAVIPLISIISLAFCPVFFDTKGTFIPYLLPPTYYVNAAYDSRYLLYMALYTLAMLAVCAIIHFLKKVRLRNLR